MHDYILGRNGSIKLLRKTNDKFDRLFSSDMKNSITIEKMKAENGSIIGDLAAGAIFDNSRYSYLSGRDGEKLFPMGINRARTTNASDAANVFLFAANNSNVEWGLAGYNTGSDMTYAIWTGHSEDRTPSSILYQGISKLSFEIHSHPGGTLIPSPINGANKGDYGVAGHINNIFYKNGSTSYPRHFMYSKQGKHLWEYNYTSAGDTKYYPGNPKLNKPMPVRGTINLKTLGR